MTAMTRIHSETATDQHLEPLLLRPADAAKLLGISRSRCYQMVQRGELPAVRLGGTVRLPMAELRQMIADQLTMAS